MKLLSDGIRRSLLVGIIANLQDEDAAESATRRCGMIDWHPVEGFGLFQGPILSSTEVCVEVELELERSPAVGVADVAERTEQAA